MYVIMCCITAYYINNLRITVIYFTITSNKLGKRPCAAPTTARLANRTNRASGSGRVHCLLVLVLVLVPVLE